MATREEKTNDLREKIIQSAEKYSQELAGKVFLYVVGTEYFEVNFPTDRFRHLTGVCTTLSAREFYKKAKTRTLENNQFDIGDEQQYRNAKKKLSCLHLLPDLTNKLVCVVKDMRTQKSHIVYKLGITNLSFTVGLTENQDLSGNRLNGWYVPQTLRVNDKAIENSQDSDFVDFILMREATKDKYETVMYSDPDKHLPETVAAMLNEELWERFYGEEETSSC